MGQESFAAEVGKRAAVVGNFRSVESVSRSARQSLWYGQGS